jgi:hypothetical protein
MKGKQLSYANCNATVASTTDEDGMVQTNESSLTLECRIYAQLTVANHI